MAWTLVDFGTVPFADGDASGPDGGHKYTFTAGAPAVGDIDILFANSDTLVATPTDFTCPPGASVVNNQGAYGFYRQALGGESGHVVITTSGNFNAVLGWQRWRGGDAFDVAVGAQINSSVGGTTPAIDTGTLAGTDELVVVAALLHRLATPGPTTPVWSSGYTGLTEVTQSSGSSGCTQFTAYRTDAGPTAETPSATWTDGAFDRYAIALVFTPNPVVSAEATPATVAATATIPTPDVSIGAATTPDSIAAMASLPAPSLSTGATTGPTLISALWSIPPPAVTAQRNAFASPSPILAGWSIPTPSAGEVPADRGPGRLTLTLTPSSTLTATTTPASSLTITRSP